MADARAVAESLFTQAAQWLQRGDHAQAELLLSEALVLAPDLAEAHANLAWLLDRSGRVARAVDHYRQALHLQPDNAQVWVNYGAVLTEQRRLGEAQAAYQQALQADPLLVDAWCNLGATQAQAHADVQAERSLNQALALNPEHASAHFNLACLLLRQGRWELGWQHLEWRTWYRAFEAELSCPRWRGESLAGRSLLVGYEAGHGDVIQFCRYVPLLAAAGAARVGIVCQPALQSLLRSLPGVDGVMPFDGPWPRQGWDCWVPLLSLPGLMGSRPDKLPAHLPYVQPDAARVPYWEAQFSQICPRPTLRVGLVWQGNPDFENDAQRSLSSLAVLAPLWSVPGVSFVSLQKGTGESQADVPPPGQPLWALGGQLQDFADTAAALTQLDLVISVDTAVAHLAGALGKPCWLMLPAHLTDWRWLQRRDDSPWYPGVMRLFRQTRTDDWTDVVYALRQALIARVSQATTPR